jgi:hypothetical protein
MTRDIIIDGVTKGARNHGAEAQYRPETGQLRHNSQSSRGFGKDAALFQEQESLKVLRGESEVFQNQLRLFGLQRGEFELPAGVSLDREIDPGIAPVADSIEHDDPLVPGPLMHASFVSREA